jgi:hypothetical protein
MALTSGQQTQIQTYVAASQSMEAVEELDDAELLALYNDQQLKRDLFRGLSMPR